MSTSLRVIPGSPAPAEVRHSIWSRDHRASCRACRDAYNAYERRRRPARGLAALRESRIADELEARREWLLDIGAADLRRLAGISQQTIASALGVSAVAVGFWESGRRVPASAAGAAYCRVIAGLARHAEIPDSGPPRRGKGWARYVPENGEMTEAA